MRWARLALGAFAALAASLAILLQWPLRLDLTVTPDSAHTGEVRVVARISPWPFFASIPVYRRNLPLSAASGANTQWKLASLRKALARLSQILRMLATIASLDPRLIELTWHSLVGTGDAASTAIACGQLAAVKSTLAGWAYSRWGKGQRSPAISVSPDFTQPAFRTWLHLVVETTLYMFVGNAQLRASLSPLLAALGKPRPNEPAAGHEY